MKLADTFKTAFKGLRANTSRSLLTILGVVVGITAIMLVVFVSSGATGLVLGQIESLGADTIIIRPGREPSGFQDIAETLFSNSLKTRDVEALKRKSNVPDAESVSPAVIIPGGVSSGRETFRATIFGWSAEHMAEMFDIYPEEGVLFTEDDIRTKAAVAVIGRKVRNELFGEGDALGGSIQIKGKKFRVVGVLPQIGQISFFNMDETVVIPHTIAQKELLGIDYYHEIMVRVRDAEAVPAATHDIETTLRELHGISDPSKDDFFVETQADIADRIGAITGILGALLISIAAISLVVGGIGIMNIMFVSVTERTREIGLRKAVGATNQDILAQFLLEAVSLTIAGGIIGITLGAVLSFIISFVLSRYLNLTWPFVFPVTAAFIGFVVSAAVGLVFGLYPARQASRKSPIEALRYE